MMSYQKCALMLLISFLIMYTVMFLNVEQGSHVYLSTNRFYMALLMVAPMALVMMAVMGKMYPDKKLNMGIMIGSALVFIVVLVLLRQQAFINDKSYLKAMIPHHSSAILNSKKANIKDPEVKKLAEQIIRSQEEEIAEMKAILERMK